MQDLDATYVLRDSVIAQKFFAFVKGNWPAMAEHGKPMVAHLMTESSKRSIDQNRLYWRLLSDIADSAWLDGAQFSKDAWHEHFRDAFLPKIETPSGLKPVSTSSLNVGQFSRYIEQIEAYAASELGIELA